jgi:hypothetical protein
MGEKKETAGKRGPADGLFSRGGITREQVQAMADFLEGTCRSIVDACEALDLPEHGDWDDKLLDVNVEVCVRCGHWHESCMLEWIDTANGGVCDQCLEDDERP